MSWILYITAGLYALGLLHSLFGFYQKRQVFVRVALGMVASGFLVHTWFLLMLGLQRRHIPITNLSESLCFFAWCITLTFLVASLRYRISALGAFVLPLVSLLTIISQLMWDENHAIPPLLKSKWLYLHTSVAFLAYASFFLTCLSGIFYLIQERELKTKHFRFLYFRLPSLQVCDELLRRSLFVGFVAMSITIVTGAFWAQQAWGRFWSWDPKETASLITWAIYLLLVNYRLSSSWRGRRAAYISIIGFASTLFTFGVNWGLHTYL
ncbi:MAG TPA: c-type cytochrome biogenesis protein CcsB [Acidobacteriota bacterium]|nr:c-type cytochrome biogenesis protein CcsB [Acidobacteriota bacterium]